MYDNELRCRHLYTTYLNIMKTRRSRHRSIVSKRVISRDSNVYYRDSLPIRSSKISGSRSYTSHTRVTWLCISIGTVYNISYCASLRSSTTWTILSQYSLQATKEVTEVIRSTIYLFTHTTDEPWQSVSLTFFWGLCGSRLLCIHTRTTHRLFWLFLSCPSPIM